MTKALMRMMRSTTLPTTDTSNTVELAPSPIIGAGTAAEGRGRKEGRRGGTLVRNKEQSQSCSAGWSQWAWKSLLLPLYWWFSLHATAPVSPFYRPPSSHTSFRQRWPIRMCVWPCYYHEPASIYITKGTPGPPVNFSLALVRLFTTLIGNLTKCRWLFDHTIELQSCEDFHIKTEM